MTMTTMTGEGTMTGVDSKVDAGTGGQPEVARYCVAMNAGEFRRMLARAALFASKTRPHLDAVVLMPMAGEFTARATDQYKMIFVKPDPTSREFQVDEEFAVRLGREQFTALLRALPTRKNTGIVYLIQEGAHLTVKFESQQMEFETEEIPVELRSMGRLMKVSLSNSESAGKQEGVVIAGEHLAALDPLKGSKDHRMVWLQSTGEGKAVMFSNGVTEIGLVMPIVRSALREGAQDSWGKLFPDIVW